MLVIRSPIPAVLIVALLLCSWGAVADESSARLRFDEGRKALKEERFREAALHFEAAGRMHEHGAAPLAAAMAWMRADEPTRAADNFHLSLIVPGLSEASKKDARQQLDSLEMSLGTLAVVGPNTIRVQLDDATDVALPARLHASPGVHVLVIQRERTIERRDVIVAAGEELDVDLTRPPESKPASKALPKVAATPLPRPESLPPIPTWWQRHREPLGYGAIGSGVTLGIVSGILGAKTLEARGRFDSSGSRDDYDSAVALRTWTNVSGVGAFLLAAAGASVVIWPFAGTHSSVKIRAGSSRLEINGGF